ncbi:peptidase S10, serine carboxypeptidase, Alpha/Beta hydrolase fold protein [Artemisia annua]|uniref:Carboxypeptidase n=1 Tax=Artemisia annua TaxID=35608 RepID=A0A2U1NX15_ARTAN|nr:peptidase S10, serine carboxypeptidase, Alpha/Beta hydrolase fold protein [Artemisia annua]
MCKSHFAVLLFIITAICIILPHFHGGLANAAGTQDGSEQWGYVEVRPRAHMFWWHYKSPYRTQDPSKPWPIILWLQGGPGASGVGIGNFEEVGPLDNFLNPRNSTWLKKGDLLFVDNPVGTGYSFVEDKELLVKTDEEAGRDLTTLLIKLFNKNKTLQRSPLYIVAESYGGKYAVTLGLSALKAIKAGKLKLTLGGIALGNSWMSPMDFVASWGPLLKDVSRIDNSGLVKSNSLVETIRQQIANGSMKEATKSWGDLEGVIMDSSNSVDFYNFLSDSGSGGGSLTTSMISTISVTNKYLRHLDSLRVTAGGDGDLGTLMNGVIKKKLKIIPKDVTWGGQSDLVFEYLSGDFMSPKINEVDKLLRAGVNVTVYNGQLDLICATKGVEAWVEKLKWEGLNKFLSIDRTPMYCGADRKTRGFTKSYKNFHFYWILEAGHFVPVNQPCVTLDMVGNITRSPNK